MYSYVIYCSQGDNSTMCSKLYGQLVRGIVRIGSSVQSFAPSNLNEPITVRTEHRENRKALDAILGSGNAKQTNEQ